MAIPARPVKTGNQERDQEAEEAYMAACRACIHKGDIPYLPPGLPNEYLSEPVREALRSFAGSEPAETTTDNQADEPAETGETESESDSGPEEPSGEE